MADSIEILKELALLIRNATKTGENTAERVGRTLVGIVENLSSIDIEELKKIFLFKIKPDETQYLIKFFAGLEAGLYAEGGKDGSKLHKSGLAELGSMQVNGDSEFRGNLSSQEFISGFLTGRGWAIQMKKYLNAAGVEEYKAVGELDDLIVRGTLRVFEFVVSQLLGENDNRIFTAMLEVDHYDAATGKVYLDTQEGKFCNPFRVDDYIMVQQYNGMPSEENNHYVTKQYELIVTAIGMEGDLAWVTFKNFTTSMEGGTPESLITRKDTFVRVDNLSDPDRKGIIQMMTVGSNTPYMDVAYGLKTDPSNALKVRIGKLEGLYNSLFGWLQSYGAYLINLYAVGEYRQRNTGEDIDTKIQMLKEQFLTQYKKQYYDITEEDNFLKNAAFLNNLEFWNVASGTTFLTINDNPFYVNRSLLCIKEGFVGVEEHDGKNMLRITNNAITQQNAHITKPGTHLELDGSGEEIYVSDTLYLSLKVQFVTSGTLTVGFRDSAKSEKNLPFVEEEIAVINPREYKILQWSGTWDGYGDFELGYTGDMYVSLLSLTTNPLDNFKISTSTQFKQTDSVIGMYGEKIDNINRTITNLGVEIDAANEKISLYANKVDNLEDTVTRLGLEIDAVDERVTLYAQKISENEQSIAKLEVRVDGISSEVISEIDGNTVVSKINQTATTVSISASKINLEGLVTANSYFKIKLDGSMEATAGLIGGFEIDNQGLRNTHKDAYISYEGYGKKAALGKGVSATWTHYYPDGTSISATESLAMSCSNTNGAANNYALQVNASGALERNVAIISTGGTFAGLRFGCFVPNSKTNTYNIEDGNVILFKYGTYNTCYIPALKKEDDGLVLFVKNAIDGSDDTPECYIVPWSGYKINYDRGLIFTGKYTGGSVDNSYGLRIDGKGDSMMLVYRHADKTFYQFKNPRDW